MDTQIVSFRTDSELVNRAVEKEFVKNKQYAPLLENSTGADQNNLSSFL